MKWAKKKSARTQAWQLGKNTPMEQKMIKEGKIRLRNDGRYELFSQESKSRRWTAVSRAAASPRIS